MSKTNVNTSSVTVGINGNIDAFLASIAPVEELIAA